MEPSWRFFDFTPDTRNTFCRKIVFLKAWYKTLNFTIMLIIYLGYEPNLVQWVNASLNIYVVDLPSKISESPLFFYYILHFLHEICIFASFPHSNYCNYFEMLLSKQISI